MHFFKDYSRFIEIWVAGSFDCSISDLTLNLLFPTLCIFILYFFLNNMEYYPNNVQNFFEYIYECMYDFLLNQIGENLKDYIPYLMALMLYIIILNLCNLCPWAYGATSQLAVNFSLALIVFFMVIHVGICHYGLNIFKHFILDVPLLLKPFMFFLELISFLIRPFTLAARLSINVLVGHMLLHMISDCVNGSSSDLVCLIGTVFLYFMEIFVAFLQAYIFIILACVYISEMSNGH